MKEAGNGGPSESAEGDASRRVRLCAPDVPFTE